METNTLLIIVTVVLAAILIILFLMKDKISDKIFKEETAQALVISKLMNRVSANKMNYIIRFQADGKLLTLYSNSEFYDGISEGDEGTLTYKGSNCTAFSFNEIKNSSSN